MFRLVKKNRTLYQHDLRKKALPQFQMLRKFPLMELLMVM
ncbi:hypothetical protein LL3_02785 [Bacillus amyloliquefaciens LL3]|nr:hypothetical protein LL3_02785 [Bacillus amyloliquefaciens LL3]